MSAAASILPSKSVMMKQICLFLFVHFCAMLSAQAPSFTFSRHYLDHLGGNDRGEVLVWVGEIPQGYLGISATSSYPGTYRAQTITVVDKITGDKTHFFTIDSMSSIRGFLYFEEDTTILVYGMGYVNGAQLPRLAKTDLYGNVKWAYAYDVLDFVNLFLVGVKLKNGDLLFTGDNSTGFTSQADSQFGMVCTDSLGVVKWIKPHGRKFKHFRPDGLQLYTDSTVLMVALGQFALLDSIPPFSDCGG